MTISKSIATQFKKPAGFFGKIVSNLMIAGNRAYYEIVIKDLMIQPNDRILEIGYGPGLGIDLISNTYKTCEVHGIDFSSLMYKRATKRNKQGIKDNRVHLLLGDFVETDITPGFNKIFCINVIYFWDDLKKPFEKIESLLKDDGILCFYMARNDDLNKINFTRDDTFKKYSIEQVAESLKSAGFSSVEYYFKRGYYIKAKKL